MVPILRLYPHDAELIGSPGGDATFAALSARRRKAVIGCTAMTDPTLSPCTRRGCAGVVRLSVTGCRHSPLAMRSGVTL